MAGADCETPSIRRENRPKPIVATRTKAAKQNENTRKIKFHKVKKTKN